MMKMIPRKEGKLEVDERGNPIYERSRGMEPQTNSQRRGLNPLRLCGPESAVRCPFPTSPVPCQRAPRRGRDKKDTDKKDCGLQHPLPAVRR